MERYFVYTKDKERLNAASIMMRYPLKYFANPKNVSRLETIFFNQPHVISFIKLLHDIQSEIASYLISDSLDVGPYTVIKSVLHNETFKHVEIKSDFTQNDSKPDIDSARFKLIFKLNQNVSERINGTKILDSKYCSEFVASLIGTCWLVEHFALLTLGALTLSKSETGSFVFQPRMPEMFKLVWFGNALESASIEADNLAFNQFVNFLMFGNVNDEGSYINHVSNVYSIVGKHWRIGYSGPLKRLFKRMRALISILVYVYKNSVLENNIKPLHKSGIKRIWKNNSEHDDLLSTYKEITAFIKNQADDDRLFDIRSGGLILGPVEIARGLIALMEHFAFKSHGPNWQNQMEGHQKEHLLNKLVNFDHIDVLNFELKPEHIQSGKSTTERLDVDYFVRDKRTAVVYAVQMKHIKSISESGLSAWLKMFGEYDSKLNTGILQLQNLKGVLKNSNLARQHLIDHGILEQEIDSIIPVVVHNVGYIDFMLLQDGVWLYDQITFIKALTGRSGVKHLYKNGSYEVLSTEDKLEEKLRLDEPLSIVNSYLSDPNFHQMRQYDLAENLVRKLFVKNTIVESHGIGL